MSLHNLQQQLKYVESQIQYLLDEKKQIELEIKELEEPEIKEPEIKEVKINTKIPIDEELDRLRRKSRDIDRLRKEARMFGTPFNDGPLQHKIMDEMERLSKLKKKGTKEVTRKIYFEKQNINKMTEEKIEQKIEPEIESEIPVSIEVIRDELKQITKKKKRIKSNLNENNYVDSNDIALLHKYYAALYKDKFNKKPPLPRTRPKIDYDPYLLIVKPSDHTIDHNNYKTLLKRQIMALLKKEITDDDKLVIKPVRERKKHEKRTKSKTKKEVWEEYKQLFEEKFPKQKRPIKQTAKKNIILEALNKLSS